MYVERVPNRNSPPAILLRESYRDGNKTGKRTLANLSDWPEEKIEALRRVLRGDAVAPSSARALLMRRSLPHGHVAAALGTVRKLGLDRLLSQNGRHPKHEGTLCLAMIVARLIAPASKLGTARLLDDETATCSLGQVLGLEKVDQPRLYAALDWLLEQREHIEAALARRHLKGGAAVLHDVSSNYFERGTWELVRDREGKKGNPQIVFRVLCSPAGCPVAVEVFDGHVGAPPTLKNQVATLKRRFGLKRMVVGGRGMITGACLEPVTQPANLDFVTALRAPAIRKLVETGDLQLSLFDDRNLAEITSPDYPNERLVVCRHPVLADERELLDAIERKLRDVQTRVRCDNKPLRGQDAIAIAVGSVINRYNMSKHFDVTITDNDLVFERKRQSMDAETTLDGIYVIRTSVKAEDLNSISIVQAYKGLAHVERAFGSLETFDLEMRPIYHRVRAHVLLCMLAYHVEWHMREALKPVLFDDHDELAVEATGRSVVAAAPRLEAAQCSADTQGTDDNLPVHSFRSLMADLATFTRNTMAMADSPDTTFLLYPELTPVQQRTFRLLDVPARL